MRILLSIILFVLLTAVSCEKKEGPWSTTLEGQVEDYYTHEQVSHIKLLVESCDTYCKEYDTVYADVNGRFYHELTGIYPSSSWDRIDYKITVMPNEAYAFSNTEEVDIENTNNYSFQIKPFKRFNLVLSDSSYTCNKLYIQTSFASSSRNIFSHQDTTLIELRDTNSLSFKCIPESDIDIYLKFYSNDVFSGSKFYHAYIENTDSKEININY